MARSPRPPSVSDVVDIRPATSAFRRGPGRTGLRLICRRRFAWFAPRFCEGHYSPRCMGSRVLSSWSWHVRVHCTSSGNAVNLYVPSKSKEHDAVNGHRITSSPSFATIVIAAAQSRRCLSRVSCVWFVTAERSVKALRDQHCTNEGRLSRPKIPTIPTGGRWRHE